MNIVKLHVRTSRQRYDEKVQQCVASFETLIVDRENVYGTGIVIAAITQILGEAMSHMQADMAESLLQRLKGPQR